VTRREVQLTGGEYFPVFSDPAGLRFKKKKKLMNFNFTSARNKKKKSPGHPSQKFRNYVTCNSQVAIVEQRSL
jgi:hypothetical protein